ncbi:MAG TPA: hypothetical protein VG275_05645 [Solirubrobacteraceae bacterium]|nr:hypothetical protein [Solirubrobacteraceae bacterium]
MPRSPSLARDAALYRMRRINRWMLAGAVVGTGLLTDVAAQAFPGHTIKRTAGSSSGTSTVTSATTTHRHRTRHRAHTPLKPATRAPQPQVVEPVPGATSSAAPAQAAPAPVQSAPVQSAPVQSAPAPAPVQSAPAPAPVVSGGS